MKSITDLPSEDIYPLIFSNLSINDLFNCRLVNKQFKYCIDHANVINKLIIGKPNSYVEEYYWYYNNKPIEDKDIINLERFRLIKLLSIFNLDKYLKYLKIYDQQFNLEELSNLINLEYLEFGYEYRNENQKIINLNNLKVLATNQLSIKLITPKLEKIKFDNIIKIKLDSNPESIKHLITTNYDNKLEIFKNLEIIELRQNYVSINENLLIIFKYLKQLKNFGAYLHGSTGNSFIKILKDKIKSRREIDIYLEGVKIESIDKYHELNEKNGYPYWKFRLNNYDLLDLNLSSINYLNYHLLEAECVDIKNDLSSTFFDKFQCIHQVNLVNVNDVDGLNWFLNNLKQLVTVYIESRVSYGQLFYNNLPNSIRYLFIFNIEDINYDFILKLSKLIEFHTCVDKDLFDSAFASVLNLKYLKKFRFHFKGIYIEIKKNGKDFYLGNLKLDYNQLVEKCESIRLIRSE